MAKIKLNLAELNPLGKAQLGIKVKTALTGNALFPNPDPSLAVLGERIDAVNAAIQDLEAKRAATTQANTAVYARADELAKTLTDLAVYVEKASAGDPEKIQTTGMDIRAAATPTTDLGQVVNLAVSAGDEQGELDAQWDRLPRAKYYEFQTSPAADTGAWTPQGTGTVSKTTIKGLTSGCKIWVRVRAHGPNGLVGAWSDPAFKIVP